MRPYNVEIMTPSFELVATTNISEITYKEDYLSSDENSITVLTLSGIKKQDYIRISRGNEEYVGVISEISFGTDKSKSLQTISFKPLIELFNIPVLFDTSLQGTGSLEAFICQRIQEMFLTNEDEKQNITGLQVKSISSTENWSLHITPSEKGGHYNIVNLLTSVMIPALQKYSVFVKTKLNLKEKQIEVTVGRTNGNRIVIESDLPNILKKNLVLRQSSADINKLVLYDTTTNYKGTITYYLHKDFSYDRNNTNRMVPVICQMKTVTSDESTSFEQAASNVAADTFSRTENANLIELTMLHGDTLVKPSQLEFGQEVDIICGTYRYRSILTGREIGKTTKLIFGTVRLDLTKLLRRNVDG